MASQWFVRGGGKVYGPVDDAQLRRLVAERKMDAATEVATQASGPWHPAGRIRGLFNASEPASRPTLMAEPAVPTPLPPDPPQHSVLNGVSPPTMEGRINCPACASLCDVRSRWCPRCGFRFADRIMWLAAGAAVGICSFMAIGAAVYWRQRVEAQGRQTALQQELEQQDSARKELEKERLAVLQSLADLEREIAVSQKNVTGAIDAAVPGMMCLDFQVASAAKDIDEARLRIDEVFRSEAQGRSSLEQVGEMLGGESNRLGPMKERSAELAELARKAAAESAVDPQRLFPARLARAQQNLVEAGSPSGRIARQIRELQARRREILDQVQAKPDCFVTRQKADEQLAALDEESKQVEAASIGFKIQAGALKY
jgi:hypothetical protein